MPPDIVAAILNKTLRVTLFDLALDTPALSEEQRNRINSMMRRSRNESRFATNRSGGFRPRAVVRARCLDLLFSWLAVASSQSRDEARRNLGLRSSESGVTSLRALTRTVSRPAIASICARPMGVRLT